MKVTLYTIPGSHPGTAAQLMLDHKGIPFKRTDLFPVVSKGVVRALGFPRNTVPAMKIDGEKVQGSRQIARELDRLQPDPPLFPADPEKRAAVEEAERFGDEELQHPIRQIIWWAFRKDKCAPGQLLGGGEARHPDPARGQDRRPGRRARRRALNEADRRERPAPTSRRSAACCDRSTS